ncbi:MAG: hypothetical protein ABI238_03555 [Terrimesophilobacter sp.]
MNWTPTDARRRWIVVAGLITGPALIVLSVAINFTPPSDSMRMDFDSMAANPGLIVAEALLEAIGFMVVLASFAGATQALRTRGGVLGIWGAILAIIGIVGFSFSNANGFALAELAQLPDRDAGFATAMAITSGDTASLVGTIGMAMEILGQVGILLVIGGLIRARLVPFWPLLIVVGMVANAVISTMLTTLVVDLLLLAACSWIAVKLARCSHEAWLGMPTIVPADPVSASA